MWGRLGFLGAGFAPGSSEPCPKAGQCLRPLILSYFAVPLLPANSLCLYPFFLFFSEILLQLLHSSLRALISRTGAHTGNAPWSVTFPCLPPSPGQRFWQPHAAPHIPQGPCILPAAPSSLRPQICHGGGVIPLSDTPAPSGCRLIFRMCGVTGL